MHKRCTRMITMGLLALLTAGCAGRPAVHRFAAVAPITTAADTLPSPLPGTTSYAHAFYSLDTMVRRPVLSGLSFSPPVAAGDVNAMDDVPASSWYTPRLGYRDLSPEELIAGPRDVGPPQAPITVVRAKSGGGNPGFIIADGRGERYLIKFDPPEFPAIETTTALIVNRLFWAFGYNVPEDYLFYFSPEDLGIDPDSEMKADDVQAVLDQVAAPVDGRYRSTASLYIAGRILGPLADSGTRKGDRNDIVPHQDRRVMRAMKVFGAFLNHSGMRIDNSLDAYMGEPGQGYVKHYLLDFGEALGGHGAARHFMWDGFEYYFGFSQFFANLATGGFRVQGWEDLQYQRWPSVGTFESTVFDPETWKPVRPYEPIRHSLPDDNYWAAKILASLQREQLAALIDAAGYPSPGAAAYILDTLLERRDKTVAHHFARVSAVDAMGIEQDTLNLRNRHAGSTAFGVHFHSANDRQISETLRLEPLGGKLAVPEISRRLEAAGGYLIVEVLAYHGNEPAPRSAQFHIRDHGGRPRLVGVVH
jgi:hypothetical protein